MTTAQDIRNIQQSRKDDTELKAVLAKIEDFARTSDATNCIISTTPYVFKRLAELGFKISELPDGTAFFWPYVMGGKVVDWLRQTPDTIQEAVKKFRDEQIAKEKYQSQAQQADTAINGVNLGGELRGDAQDQIAKDVCCNPGKLQRQGSAKDYLRGDNLGHS